jgi:hypothetical protein
VIVTKKATYKFKKSGSSFWQENKCSQTNAEKSSTQEQVEEENEVIESTSVYVELM